ncbi:putative short-chain dehydrogenase/reductase SDR [Streptomyces sp. Tu6071]|uniref:SDR family NAD(P)-dependent oxidoreductase n=1 Tax=Streptomyces sp. Tu6071 TaxID=355249 RepID=UPI00020E5DFD|nr:SDR family oxidoreductase [Streptomyces sp. Tu6071]EGJ77298.1 putative short-chain dehydrogenase/reductase SDR [Streptomyces sp. Tu6071]
MSSDNTGRTAVVTGASKGIGAGIAKALAESGAAVVVNYRTDAEGAERVVAEITAKGGRALAVRADVAQGEEEVRELFARTRAAYGPVDILVNNAGVVAFGPLTELTEEEFHRETTTNMLAPMLTTKALAAQEDVTEASVVNVSTGGTLSHPTYASLYVATKSALEAYTIIAAKELGPRGIRVNAVQPGASDTEGTRAAGYVGSELEARAIAATPLGRSGTPGDYGPLVAFLASEDARWITGALVLASGGSR